MYIYRLYFPNGKSYVGQTKNLRNRLYAHKSSIGKTNAQTELYKEMEKVGWENITLNVLSICEPEQADYQERMWIKALN